LSETEKKVNNDFTDVSQQEAERKEEAKKQWLEKGKRFRQKQINKKKNSN